jgi:hypothetical protein
MDDERFVRELVTALPEAFDADWEDDYSDADGWLGYTALGSARSWLEDHALRIAWLGRRRGRAGVRPEGEEPLRRFFAYIEQVAQEADEEAQGLLLIELT